MTRIVAALVLLLTISCAHSQTTCPSTGGDPVQVAAVEPRLELRLADGRTLRLVGLDAATASPADPDLGDAGRATLTAAIAGKPISATILSDKPDRWGRRPAMAFIGDDPAPGGLAAIAVAAGLGRYLAEPGAHGCRAALLEAEGKARAAALGLWRDPYYGVVAVDDRDAFTERAATTVMAEGRLWRVDPGPFRTKLRFAAPGLSKRGLLVAVVLPKIVKRFEEQGVHFQALIGRTLRLRGLLDLRFGPQIEVAGPDALEVVPDASAVPSSASATP